MAKYQLTISADDPAELADILNGTAPGGAALSDDPSEVLTKLQELMDAEGKTVVVRAKRNSRGSSSKEKDKSDEKPKGKETEKPKDDGTGFDDADEGEAEAEGEAEGEDDAPAEYDFDTVFDTVMEAVKDQSNPELSAKVRKAVSAVAANMDGVKKLSDITDHDQQVQFVESMVSGLPELFGGKDEDATDPAAEDVFA